MLDPVPVVCLNGHAINVWGGPLMAAPGTNPVVWWGSPFTCGKCGATCKAVV